MVQIVTVNVSLQVAPTPSTLQQAGALISMGATSQAAGSLTLLTQLSDLTPILDGTFALTSLSWASGVVTATTTAPHGFTVAGTPTLTISGAVPVGYNGTYVCTITGASTFTYPHAGTLTTPASTPGSWTEEDVAELLAMATTFFAQGTQASVYVLELGPTDPVAAIAALTTFITNNPNTIYAYLTPRTWDSNSAFLSLIASYENTTAKTYFIVTTTTANYTNFTSLMKDVIAFIEAPGIPVLEFTAAAFLYNIVATNPSSSNKVRPFSYREVFGVTPYPTVGNGTLLTSLKNAGVNVIDTGSEGGISNTIVKFGTTMDLNEFTFWYSIDWVQINGAQALANEVINGSNNPLNPLDYDQQGINRLQARLVGVMNSAILFRLAVGTVVNTQLNGTDFSGAISLGQFLGQCDVNAIPFQPYATANPGDFKAGRYAGLSILYAPSRPFIQIVLNIVATEFV